MENKANLRKRLLRERNEAGTEARQQWDQQIAASLLAWCRQLRPSSLGVYWPIRAEPDLRFTYPELVSLGVTLALPVVTSRSAPLSFFRWEPGDVMDEDEYGIAIPQQREQALKPDILLVPCVGYNVQNYRLGYGGGFYDRTLAELPRPQTLGIAYRCGLAEFAIEAHDLALDRILTN